MMTEPLELDLEDEKTSRVDPVQQVLMIQGEIMGRIDQLERRLSAIERGVDVLRYQGQQILLRLGVDAALKSNGG